MRPPSPPRRNQLTILQLRFRRRRRRRRLLLQLIFSLIVAICCRVAEFLRNAVFLLESQPPSGKDSIPRHMHGGDIRQLDLCPALARECTPCAPRQARQSRRAGRIRCTLSPVCSKSFLSKLHIGDSAPTVTSAYPQTQKWNV